MIPESRTLKNNQEADRSPVFRQVEVFRTNVSGPISAGTLKNNLQAHFPGARITIDLRDCDRVLRLESTPDVVNVHQVMQLVREAGFSIEPLE